MDSVIKTYLWASVLLTILFFILSSGLIYWITNRVTTTLWLPQTFNFSKGGPTLFGLILHSVVFFAVVFGIIDYVYSNLLNGDDDKDVNIE
jgi:hypothetical protein